MSALALSSILRAHVLSTPSRSSVCLISTVRNVGKFPTLKSAWAPAHVRSYNSKNDDLDNMSSYDKRAEPNPKLDELIKITDEEVKHLLPRETVAELDKFIIGQNDAKRAVAVALRNRWRRRRLPAYLKDEVIPKNILMIGPTGVGKTEIARRLAKLVSAPFIKVEATKFTEVGFHGRDVDQIIRDLVDIAITNVRQRLAKRSKTQRDQKVEARILDALIGPNASEAERQKYLEFLRKGELDNQIIELEFTDIVTPSRNKFSRTAKNIQDFVDGILRQYERQGARPPRKSKQFTVSEARRLLERQHTDTDADSIAQLAIHSVEQDGIVFIDEIDKICERKDAAHRGADASSEGVQRDLLPLIEGSTVHTKHGNVDTSHILFIASGAFHSCKPSDMISELQGRLPIRVELKPLETSDLFRILTEPETNQIKQHMELLKTEGVNLKFSESAIKAISQIAAEVNAQVENIGARRLHTILEKIMEDISFNCDKFKDQEVVVEEADVRKHLGEMLQRTDLTRFIL